MKDYNLKTLVFTNEADLEENWPEGIGEQRKEALLEKLRTTGLVLLAVFPGDRYIGIGVNQEISDSVVNEVCAIRCPVCGEIESLRIETVMVEIKKMSQSLNRMGEIENGATQSPPAQVIGSILTCDSCFTAFVPKKENGKMTPGDVLATFDHRTGIVVEAKCIVAEGMDNNLGLEVEEMECQKLG